MAMMIAARYLGADRIEPAEVPVPSIGNGEALVRVDACGFCGSDLGIVSGLHPRARPPLTIGHEFCGRVQDIGENSGAFAPGDRVTAYPLISCGACLACRNGNAHVCRDLRLYGFDTDGGMAEFVRLPVPSLVRLSTDMPPNVGAILEPLAVAVHGVSRAPVQASTTAAVLGAGPIGLLTALVARARGVPEVVITDVVPERLILAEKLRLRAVPAGEAFQRVLDETTGGEGADIVFECAGAPSSALGMTSLVRCRGTIVNLSVFKQPVPVDMQSVNFKEISVVGSRVYTRTDFDDAIELAGTLPVQAIITHSFPIAEVTAAFDLFRRREGVCKVIILPGRTP